MVKASPKRSLLAALTVCSVLGIGLPGCATAPVQEMSDARQAIRAAQNAGADRKAPKQMESAQSLLSSAEESLQKRLYRAAKRDAVQARNQAVEAMQLANSQTQSNSGSVNN